MNSSSPDRDGTLRDPADALATAILENAYRL
jgi:hypothetical protein